MSEVSFKPVGFDRARLVAMMQGARIGWSFAILTRKRLLHHRLSLPSRQWQPDHPCLAQPEPLFRLCGQRRADRPAVLGTGGMGIEYGADDVRMSFTAQMALDDLVALINEKLKPGCMVGVEFNLPLLLSGCLKNTPNQPNPGHR